jgi:hypothetical protein
MILALFHTLLHAASKKGLNRTMPQCRNALQTVCALTIAMVRKAELARRLPVIKLTYEKAETPVPDQNQG